MGPWCRDPTSFQDKVLLLQGVGLRWAGTWPEAQGGCARVCQWALSRLKEAVLIWEAGGEGTVPCTAHARFAAVLGWWR